MNGECQFSCIFQKFVLNRSKNLYQEIWLYGIVSVRNVRKINKIPCCRKLLFCAQALKSITHPICSLESQGLIKISQNRTVLFLYHNYTFEVPCEFARLVAICQGCLFSVDQKVWIRRKYSSTVWITYVQTRIGLRNSTGIKCFAQVTAKSFFQDTFHHHEEVREV